MNEPRSQSAELPSTEVWRKAERYAAAQPFIVDKTPLYEEIVRQICCHGPVPTLIAELGVGTGGFLQHAVGEKTWSQTRLLGCDQSQDMLSMARTHMFADDCRFNLIGNVNALDPSDPFYHTYLPAESADVIVLSQFEHYAPNHPTSPTAERLRQHQRTFITKTELRQLVVSRLKPGGWLFVIDDYAAPTAELNQQWLEAWDTHVVTMFARADVIAHLAHAEPKWAAQVAGRYSPQRPDTERLKLVARARSQRRWARFEETQPLADAQADFVRLFADGTYGWLAHPNSTAHPQFHLLWGQKKE